MEYGRRHSKFSAEFPPCFQRYGGTPSRRNPGNILEFHNLAHRLKPTHLDGFELDYIHHLSLNKSIIANCVLSHNKPSGFRIGGIYSGHLHDDIMKTPAIRADINPSTLSTNIGFLFYPYRCLRFETELQKADHNAPLQTQVDVEFRSNSSTITANLYDVRSDRGRTTLSYLHSVSEHLSLGSELLLEWTDRKSIMADTAIAVRFKRHYYSIAATASRQGIDVSYWQRIHRRLQLATLWAWHRKANKSVGTICYQWDFQDANVRGMLDSNLSLGFMYSRYLSDLPVSLAFSLFLNLHTNRFLFGLKLIMDPNGLRRGE